MMCCVHPRLIQTKTLEGTFTVTLYVVRVENYCFGGGYKVEDSMKEVEIRLKTRALGVG